MIQKIKQTPRTFEFEGVTVGIRFPLTSEMEEITKLREPYFKSLKAVLKDDTLPDGVSLVKLQLYIGATLCCDPSDATNPWFAVNREKQTELAKNHIDKDCPEDVPHQFHVMASEAFEKLFAKESADRQAADPSKPSEALTEPKPQTTSD